MKSPPVWDHFGCIRCVACVGSCPSGSISFRSDSIEVDGARCTRCMRCVLFCPVGCLSEGGP